MKKQAMYLDITKKVGDQSAVKTSDQLVKELETRLQVAVGAMEQEIELEMQRGYVKNSGLVLALEKIKAK